MAHHVELQKLLTNSSQNSKHMSILYYARF